MHISDGETSQTTECYERCISVSVCVYIYIYTHMLIIQRGEDTVGTLTNQSSINFINSTLFECVSMYRG